MRTCEYKNCCMPVFGTDKNTKIGYCKTHQYCRTDLDKRTPTQKAFEKAKKQNIIKKEYDSIDNLVKDISSIIKTSQNKINKTIEESGLGKEAFKEVLKDTIFENKKTDLQKWFNYVETVIKKKPYCWEISTDFIPEKYYHAASAHIFPKSIFKSIATHPLNFVVLSPLNGMHQKFDKSLDDAAEMKVFATAVNRFKKFQHLITEKHKYLDKFIEKAKEKGLL